jgi:hypothetical protein
MTPITFNVAKEDVVAMACSYYATSATVRSNRLINQVAVALIFAVAGLLALIGTGSGVVAVVLLVFGGVCVACVPSWHRRSIRRSAEKMIEESSYAKAFGPYAVVLSEEGFITKSPTGEGKHTWEAVRYAVLTPEYLFIFLVGPHGIPIQRSQLPDSTVQEVKAFVQSHIRSTEPGALPSGGLLAPLANPGDREGPRPGS